MADTKREVWVLEGDGSLARPRALFQREENAKDCAVRGEKPVRYVPEEQADARALWAVRVLQAAARKEAVAFGSPAPMVWVVEVGERQWQEQTADLAFERAAKALVAKDPSLAPGMTAHWRMHGPDEPGIATLELGTPPATAPSPYECTQANPCGACSVCWR